MEDDHTPSLQKSHALGSVAGRAVPGNYGNATPNLAKDMPLTAQISEALQGQIQLSEVILKTLMETHHRVFGPMPPRGEGAGSSPAPQPDTIESHLIGASRGLSDRLYEMQHIANCLSSRL